MLKSNTTTTSSILNAHAKTQHRHTLIYSHTLKIIHRINYISTTTTTTGLHILCCAHIKKILVCVCVCVWCVVCGVCVVCVWCVGVWCVCTSCACVLVVCVCSVCTSCVCVCVY
eukprot:GHVS01105773.1.p1 GENE.GHVS01105773.1~~GHVS01105773.1.p1  ORF type:complete len:114 (-),score=17.62 GHVS01105773.1:230-571(-)